MTDRKLKKKKQQKDEKAVTFDVGESFSPAEAKEEDFELDLDSAIFQGKKGQAGTRTKATS